MDSPFQFGKTVTGLAFVDRDEEMKNITSTLSSGNSMILISPRRWGKSSLVRKSMEESFLPNKNYHVVMLDLFRIRSEEEFFQEYAKEVIRSTSTGMEDIMRNAKSFFKNIVPRISVSTESMGGFSLQFDTKEMKENRSDILDLPENISRKKNKKIVVCVDEFQNLSAFDKPVAVKNELRSAWQHHRSVAYCLYGSKRHMMADIFNNAASPFYRFGTVLFLDKIEKKYWIPFISKAFERTKKSISIDFCERIADAMQNHPFYVQQLSHIVWSLTDTRVTPAVISEATERILEMNRPFLVRELESLSNGQVNLLRAVCHGEVRLNSSEVLKEYKLGTSGNVSKNKRILEELDIIDFDRAGIRFVDPVFELWFRNYVMG